MEEKSKNGSLRIILSVSLCFILYNFFKVRIIHSNIKPGMRKSQQPKILSWLTGGYASSPRWGDRAYLQNLARTLFSIESFKKTMEFPFLLKTECYIIFSISKWIIFLFSYGMLVKPIMSQYPTGNGK